MQRGGVKTTTCVCHWSTAHNSTATDLHSSYLSEKKVDLVIWKKKSLFHFEQESIKPKTIIYLYREQDMQQSLENY